VVVYKVDRLTRSLVDFAKLVELFEAHGVSFVAVTQQFNTTTSMGRLTLNVLLSFAQFERELAGERIRDKFAASRKKGMWMGGTIPLGYDVKGRKLVVNDEEADRVRLIFRQYLALGCVSRLRADLDERGIRSKQRVLTSGRVQGGLVQPRCPLSSATASIGAKWFTGRRRIPASTRLLSTRSYGTRSRPGLLTIASHNASPRSKAAPSSLA
jgi:site-specific DNA recombinase